MKDKFIIIKTTYPNLKSGKKLAKILLNKKLAACIHFSKIDCCYIWEGKIIDDKEISLSIKTRKYLYPKIEKIIKENHDYENPQIIGITIDEACESYLQWIDSNVENEK